MRKTQSTLHKGRAARVVIARFGDGDLATTFSGTLSQETRMLAVFFLGLRDRWPVLRIRSKCSHHSSGLWRAAPDSRLRHDKGLRIIEATCDNDCERPIPVSGLIRVGSRSRS